MIFPNLTQRLIGCGAEMAFEMKRFWKNTSAEPASGGFAVFLDKRPLKTPLKNLMIVPTLPFASAIAAEWQLIDVKIQKHLMPFTRFAEAALDAAGTEYEEIVNNLAGYGETDLLCYRAEAPIELINRQAEIWDPLLDWAAKTLGAQLAQTRGIMAIEQDADTIKILSEQIRKFDLFQLSAFYDLVKISGSLIIALAVAKSYLSPATGWQISRLDDDWQIEQWGTDDEAQQLANTKQQDFLNAHKAMVLLTNS